MIILNKKYDYSQELQIEHQRQALLDKYHVAPGYSNKQVLMNNVSILKQALAIVDLFAEYAQAYPLRY